MSDEPKIAHDNSDNYNEPRDVPGDCWNPRYVQYARAHGKYPDAMMAADTVKYPGGCMCGFILWSNEMLRQCDQAHPEFFYHGCFPTQGKLVNHEGYDAWMREQVNELLAKKV